MEPYGERTGCVGTKALGSLQWMNSWVSLAGFPSRRILAVAPLRGRGSKRYGLAVAFVPSRLVQLIKQGLCMAAFKIQLGVEDVARLLGGIIVDGKVEVPAEVSNGIVQEFTKRYLKGIVNADFMPAAIKEVRDFVHIETRRIVEDVIGLRRDSIYSSPNGMAMCPGTKLPNDFVRRLTDAVRLEVDNSIRVVIHDEVAKVAVSKDFVHLINETISRYVKDAVKKLVAEGLQNQLKAALDESGE